MKKYMYNNDMNLAQLSTSSTIIAVVVSCHHYVVSVIIKCYVMLSPCFWLRKKYVFLFICHYFNYHYESSAKTSNFRPFL